MYPHLVLCVIRKSVPPVDRYSPFLCFHIVWLKIGVPFGCPNCAVEYSLWCITMQVLSLGVDTLGGIVFALFWSIESIMNDVLAQFGRSYSVTAFSQIRGKRRADFDRVFPAWVLLAELVCGYVGRSGKRSSRPENVFLSHSKAGTYSLELTT